MHRINQQRQRTSRPSPNRYNADTYIIQYKQSKDKINSPKGVITVPVSPFELLKDQNYKKDRKKQSILSSREKDSQKYVDHRKNIDRLMEVLKSKSKSQDKGSSAVHKIVKIIDKIYQRYWRIYERIMKRKGFEAIHKVSGKLVKPANISHPFFLKDSLEFQENQIQKFSKNFELQDLIQIVDLHTKENQLVNPVLDNSLSRQLNNQDNIHKPTSKSPRKISQNIYIMKKNTKQQLSTRPELSNFTTQNHLKSIQNIHEGTNAAEAILSSKIEGRSLQKNIELREKSLKLKQKYSVIKEIPLQELSIDSFIKAKPSEAQGQGIQIQKQLSNIKLPIFGEKNVQRKRTNRLMNPQNKGRKIFFHYKNSHQKIHNPLDNYYAGVKANEFNRLKHKNPLADTRMETNSTNPSLPFQNNEQRHQFESQQVRVQRSTSMQVLSPKNVFQQQQENQNKEATQQLEELAYQKKRCSSMPKITFTYKIKEDFIIKPQIISQNFQRAYPIILLNQPQTINQKIENFVKHQDPYLNKNTQITNTYGFNDKTSKISKCISPQKLCNQAYTPQRIIQNDYKIPVQNYIVANKLENPHILQKVDRLKIYSNQQASSNKYVFDNNLKAEQIRKNEYYNCKDININSGKAIQARQLISNHQRNRVRSTDAYILTKRIDTKPLLIPQKIRQDNISPLQRNRTKSCGIKLQLISKVPHLIQAY